MAQAVIIKENPQDRAEIFDHRVAVLRQLKKNLLRQRARLEEYLAILDEENTDIGSGNLEKLTAHIDMERAVVSEIQTLQKVIVPLEKLYRSSYPDREEEIPVLKSSLRKLTSTIIRRNRANRDLLKREMERVEKELSLIRVPLRKHDLFNLPEVSTLIDIST